MSSESSSLKALACDVAALLEEKDPMSDSEDSDMALRLSILRSQRQKNSLGRWARIAQIAQEYRKMLKVKEDNEPVDAEEVGVHYPSPDLPEWPVPAIPEYPELPDIPHRPPAVHRSIHKHTDI